MEAPRTPAPPESLGRATLLRLFYSFFVTGIVTALLGPLLPFLIRQHQLSPEQAGTLFVAQFAGSSLGALLSQLRPRLSIILGLACMAAGVGALPLAGWQFLRVAVFIFGLGLGLSIPATNMAIAYGSPHRRAAALNLLNLMWGAGAATTPLLVRWAYPAAGLQGISFAVATLAAAACALVALSPASAAPTQPRNALVEGTQLHPGLLLYCALLFLYIGMESSVGGWLAVFVLALGGSSTAATTALVAFWVALLGGRGLAPLVLRHVRELTLLRASLAAAAGALALLACSTTPAMAGIAGCIAGAALAPVFSLHVSQMTHYVEARGAAAPGWLFSLAGMGGAALPWTVGKLSTATSSYRPGFAMLLSAALASLLLLEFARRKSSPAN